MNETIEEFKLDESGICNFCLEWNKKKSTYLNFTKEEENKNLENLKKKLLKLRKSYDCIVGLSGGTDSSFVIYKLWKMGIKPLEQRELRRFLLRRGPAKCTVIALRELILPVSKK